VQDEWTNLHYAAIGGDADQVRRLIDAKADLGAKTTVCWAIGVGAERRLPPVGGTVLVCVFCLIRPSRANRPAHICRYGAAAPADAIMREGRRRAW
jgi:hypothetical protein